MSLRILYVDDEAANATVFKYAFDQFDLRTETDPHKALQRMAEGDVAVLVTDQRMPGMDGMTLARKARGLHPELVVVLVTAYSSQELLQEALNSGLVWRFVAKPWEPAMLAQLLDEAIEVARTRREGKDSEAPAGTTAPAPFAEAESRNAEQTLFWDFSTAQMREMLTRLEQVAGSDTAVLIGGETGTGKEQIARRLHRLSRCRDRPFVAVNCGALTESLLESELFGHRKGAFTGAVADRAGLLQLADGGTLFLDEIAELSPRGQAALLRVLQEGTYTPVGAEQTQTSHFRLLAATHRDLRQRVSCGEFREDLYWRVAQFSLHLPSLRDRPEDLENLFGFFARRIATQLGRPEVQLNASLRTQLLDYPWPGNLRELEAEVRRYYLVGQFSTGSGPSAGVQAQSEASDSGKLSLPTQGTLDQRLSTVEKQLIEQALVAHQSNTAAAARELGLKRTTLLYRMKKMDIDI